MVRKAAIMVALMLVPALLSMTYVNYCWFMAVPLSLHVFYFFVYKYRLNFLSLCLYIIMIVPTFTLLSLFHFHFHFFSLSLACCFLHSVPFSQLSSQLKNDKMSIVILKYERGNNRNVSQTCLVKNKIQVSIILNVYRG